MFYFNIYVYDSQIDWGFTPSSLIQFLTRHGWSSFHDAEKQTPGCKAVSSPCHQDEADPYSAGAGQSCNGSLIMQQKFIAVPESVSSCTAMNFYHYYHYFFTYCRLPSKQKCTLSEYFHLSCRRNFHVMCSAFICSSSFRPVFLPFPRQH